MLRVLVACEYSGTVRDAFARAGHVAVSCDLLPTDSPGLHWQGDVAEILTLGWDLMIAFPPCTYLCGSGMHWTTRGKRDPQHTEDALAFVQLLMTAPIPRIAIENPVGVISSRIRPPDQIIHPWQFGHDANKRTCLWLKGLPLLRATSVIPRDAESRRSNQTPSGQNKVGQSKSRWKTRSKTYQGIAEAMAQQWS